MEVVSNNAGTLEATIPDSSSLVAKLRGYIDITSNIEPQSTLNAESQGNLFVPFLGQSNGLHMSIVYDPYQLGSTANNSSGAIVLSQNLSSLTDSNIITSDTRETNFAIGGSKANGNGYYIDDSHVWWYPEQNQPGGALLQAEQGLTQWLSNNEAQPADEIAIVWSQGESDVGDIVSSDPATKEAYKQSTLEIFDYLRNSLEYEDITFYLVPTGRLQAEGAANVGLNPEEIDAINEGIGVIREAQSEIAIERDDVQLAPDYSDLNMVYEEGQIYGESYDQDYNEWSRDFWHLGHDGLKVNGDRLAQYIALDRGENNVISFTDSFGDPAQSISLTRDGILDLNIAANPSSEIIQDTINPDLIVGSLSADVINGKNGNDLIVATEGVDTLTGGNGNDIFFYTSTTTQEDIIADFRPGSDRLDVSELLRTSGYSGNDPIADGYIVVNSLSESSLEIQFDIDGVGEQPANTLAILENINPTEFQNDLNNQFVFVPTEF